MISFVAPNLKQNPSNTAKFQPARPAGEIVATRERVPVTKNIKKQPNGRRKKNHRPKKLDEIGLKNWPTELVLSHPSWDVDTFEPYHTQLFEFPLQQKWNTVYTVRHRGLLDFMIMMIIHQQHLPVIPSSSLDDHLPVINVPGTPLALKVQHPHRHHLTPGGRPTGRWVIYWIRQETWLRPLQLHTTIGIPEEWFLLWIYSLIVYRSTIGLELKLNYKVPSAYPLSYSPYGFVWK